jgi:hypothetical protein
MDTLYFVWTGFSLLMISYGFQARRIQHQAGWKQFRREFDLVGNTVNAKEPGGISMSNSPP